MSNRDQHGNREAKKAKKTPPKTIAETPTVKEVFLPGKRYLANSRQPPR
ncbi:MAG: hypothetical protein WCJ64_25980 [Rhodospirillaceae bacterium]